MLDDWDEFLPGRSNHEIMTSFNMFQKSEACHVSPRRDEVIVMDMNDNNCQWVLARHTMQLN